MLTDVLKSIVIGLSDRPIGMIFICFRITKCSTNFGNHKLGVKYRSLNKRELPYGDSGIDRRKHIVRLSLTRHISIPTLPPPPPPPEKRFKKNMPPPAFVFVQIKIKIKNLPPASVSSKSGLRNNGIIFFGLKVNNFEKATCRILLRTKLTRIPDEKPFSLYLAAAFAICYVWCLAKTARGFILNIPTLPPPPPPPHPPPPPPPPPKKGLKKICRRPHSFLFK